jgi:hypothetical protein
MYIATRVLGGSAWRVSLVSSMSVSVMGIHQLHAHWSYPLKRLI